MLISKSLTIIEMLINWEESFSLFVNCHAVQQLTTDQIQTLEVLEDPSHLKFVARFFKIIAQLWIKFSEMQLTSLSEFLEYTQIMVEKRLAADTLLQ